MDNREDRAVGIEIGDPPDSESFNSVERILQ